MFRPFLIKQMERPSLHTYNYKSEEKLFAQLFVRFFVNFYTIKASLHYVITSCNIAAHTQTQTSTKSIIKSGDFDS